MGMAASQARLLTLTARQSDIELKSQQISNSKMRLASESEQVSTNYLQALNATKLTVNNMGNSEQLSYNSIMSPEGIMSGSYNLQTSDGKVIVSKQISNVYEKSNNLSSFLNQLNVQTITDNSAEVASTRAIWQSAHAVTLESIRDKELFLKEKDLSVNNDGSLKFPTTYSTDDVATTEDTSSTGGAGGAGNVSTTENTSSTSGAGGAGNVSTVENTSSTGGAGGSGNVSTVENTSSTGGAGGSGNVSTVKDTSSTGGASGSGKVSTVEDTSSTGGASGSGKVSTVEDTSSTGGASGSGKVSTVEDTSSTGGASGSGKVSTVEDTSSTGGASGSGKVSTVEDTSSTGGASGSGKVATVGDTSSTGGAGGSGNISTVKDTSSTGGAGGVRLASRAIPMEDTLSNDYNNENKIPVTPDKPVLKDVYTATEKADLTTQYNQLVSIISNNQLKENEAHYAYQTAFEENSKNNIVNTSNATNRSYYTNLYNQIQSSGYVSFDQGQLNNPDFLQSQLANGNWFIGKRDNGGGNYMKTAISSNTMIKEVSDDKDVARAEAEYNEKTLKINNKEKKLDMQLKSLDTEHAAVKTEFDSVKSLIKDNVEKGFAMFS